MRNLLVLTALLTTAGAYAADVTEAERRTVALVVDFCGEYTAQQQPDADAVAAKIPGLALGPPGTIDQITSDEGSRRSLTKFLSLDEGQEIRLAAFAPTPTRNQRPHAAFTLDGVGCVVVMTPAVKNLAQALDERFVATSGTWVKGNRELREYQLATWRRDAAYGEKVFATGRSDDEGAIVFVGLERRAVPNPHEIRTIMHAAIAPCARAIYSQTRVGADAFASHFAVLEQSNKEGVESLVLRTSVPGARAMVEMNSLERFTKCSVYIGDPRMPVESVREEVLNVLRSLPGIRETTVKATRDEPSHLVWRWRKPGQRVDVDFQVDVKNERTVVLRILPEGW